MQQTLSDWQLFIGLMTPCLKSFLIIMLGIVGVAASAVLTGEPAGASGNDCHIRPDPWSDAKPYIAAMLALYACIFTYSAKMSVDGIRHGVYDPDTTLREISERLPVTPEESAVPDDVSGKLLVYFRFGCSDCEAVYNSLYSELKNIPDVYYVSTRSEHGLELLQRYPVEETPSAVYVYPDGTRFAKSVLHKTDDTGAVVLDRARLAELLAVRERKSGKTSETGGVTR